MMCVTLAYAMDGTNNAEPRTGDPEVSGGMSERARRWQKITLDQRGYTLNLILTFTVAAIGYWFGLLRDDKFLPGRLAKYSLLVAGLFLAFAAVFGFACVLIRQWDIHASFRRASQHPKRRSEAFVRGLDCWLLWLFRLHVWFFLLAIAAIASALWMTLGSKLM
jgi:hypothetical protein